MLKLRVLKLLSLRAMRSLLALLFLVFALSAVAQQTIHVPADQPTIQAAINAASDGDTILVAPGTYYEHLDFSSKAITVISSAGAATTILDGSLTGTVAFLGTPAGKAPAILNGFLVQNGEAEATHPPYPGVDYGGGVVIVGSANLLNSTIQNNNSCNVEIIAGGDVTVQGNHVLRSIFSGESGGGCHTNPFGVSVHDGPSDNLHPVHIDGNLIEMNQDDGVEVYNVSEPVFVTHNLIRNSSNSGFYGTIGIRVGAASSTVIADNVITGNAGPGLLSQITATLIVANNTFYGNSTVNADDGEASEVDIASLGTITLVNNIIVGTSPAGPPLGCSSPAGASQLPLIWDHNLIYNTITKTGSIPCTGSPGNDNLFVDPQFAGAVSGNFHLTTGSPAIDAGNDSAPYMDSTDFDGNPRIQDATGKGYGIVDMGAFEFPGLVQAPPTQLTLVAAQNFVQPGQSVPLVATAMSTLGTPMGDVTLVVDGAPFTTAALGSNGSINFTTAALKPGYHAVYATYPGQGAYSPATSLLLYISVASYTPSLTLVSSANPSAVGEDVTFTAVITSPDGAILSPIALADGRNPAVQLTPNASGFASYTTNSLILGSHNMNATYAGDATHNTAYANTVVQQVIAPYVTTTTLVSSLNPSAFGQAVTFTAQVSSASGPPTGSVQFMVDGALSKTVALDATQSAAFTISTLTATTHNIVATYVPIGLFGSSTVSLSQSVSLLGSATMLSAMSTAEVFGGSVVLHAVVSANPANANSPSGTVTFYDGAVSLGNAPIVAGMAMFSVANLPPGQDALSAIYGGDAVFAISTSNTVPVVITAATSLGLTSNVSTVDVGSTVSFTANAASSSGFTPTGTVTFLDGQTVIGSSRVVGGVATFSTSMLQPGIHSVVAQLVPDTGFTTSASVAVVVTVVPADFAVTAGTPSVTVKTGHRVSMDLSLVSMGGFSGAVSFSCDASVPPDVTCLFPNAPVTLTADGRASTTFVMDTDAILNFYGDSENSAEERAALAVLFPGCLLGFRIRRRSALRRAVMIVCLGIVALTLGACGGHYPASTPPGTYTFSVIARANPTLSHTLSVTLHVTP